MKIYINNKQGSLPISVRQVRNIVRNFLDGEKVQCDEVAIHFVTSKKISELHDQFFDDPSPTDCISFPIDNHQESYRVLGEVFVCPATAIEYAKAHSLNPYDEVTLYIVHGLLHLIGYDDMEITKKRKMRAAEKRHMKRLKALQLNLK